MTNAQTPSPPYPGALDPKAPDRSSTLPQSLPIAWVERLFARLSGFYGAKFGDMWRGCDLDSVKQIWAEALSGYTSDEIKRGIESCKGKIFPPTLPEFLLLCRPAINHESAYHEAIEQLRKRQDGADHWSHPAIYWAAVSVGTHDMMASSYQFIRARWERALGDEMSKHEWDAVPPRPLSLPPPRGESKRVAEMADGVVGRKPKSREQWIEHWKMIVAENRTPTVKAMAEAALIQLGA